MKNSRFYKGNIMVSILLVLFISLLGVSLVGFCLTHGMIVRARNIKMGGIEKLNDAIIYYLHFFREKVITEQMNKYINPYPEFFNSTNFPNTTDEKGCKISPSFKGFEYEKQGCIHTEVISTFNVSHLIMPYVMKCGVNVEILWGHIPVTKFPFLINTDQPIEDSRVYFNEKGIINKSIKKLEAGKHEVELNLSKLLLNEIKISNSGLTWYGIREKLGLPLSNDRIDEGIYIVEENGVLQSVVIEGDLQRLVFSADITHGVQKITFFRANIAYELYYKPGIKYLINWLNGNVQEKVFKEKILVDGDILSIEQENETAFLDSSNITVFASGKGVITTDLKLVEKSLLLKPLYLSNIKIITGKISIFDRGSDSGGISIDKVEKTIINATLITKGTFTNKSNELKLGGSVYCGEVENKGQIEVDYRETQEMEDNYFYVTDMKSVDCVMISYIEEVSDGNE